MTRVQSSKRGRQTPAWRVTLILVVSCCLGWGFVALLVLPASASALSVSSIGAAVLLPAATGANLPVSSVAERSPQQDEFCLSHYRAYRISPSERPFWRRTPFADELLYPTPRVMCVPERLAVKVVDPIIARRKGKNQAETAADAAPIFTAGLVARSVLRPCCADGDEKCLNLARCDKGSSCCIRFPDR